MNHREPRPLPKESLRVWRYVAMLLLPLLDPTSINATGRQRGPSQFRIDPPEKSAPYLRAGGALPLRFQEFTPPPDLSMKQPAGALPSSRVGSTNEASTPDVIIPASESVSSPPISETKTEPKETALPTKKPGPAPILPDETRPQIRAEDFLPFFPPLGSRRGPAEVSVIVPMPASAPSSAPLTPSSATYTQTPR